MELRAMGRQHMTVEDTTAGVDRSGHWAGRGGEGTVDWFWLQPVVITAIFVTAELFLAALLQATCHTHVCVRAC